MRALAFAALVLGVWLLVTASASAQSAKVLVLHGGANATNDAGVAAITALGTANGFTVDASADASTITTANLANYRAVVMLNSAGDRLNAAQETALQSYIQGGGGFVGIGSTAEAETGNTFFNGLIGARPATGSPTATTSQVVVSGDRVHPATKDLPLEWTRDDVWYQWTTRPTGTVHTVARYRAPGAPAGDGTSTGGTDWPISWCRDFQGGRSFYTGMGRTAAAFEQANLRTHLKGAIQWAAGLVRGGCKATITANYKSERVVGATDNANLDFSGESHGVAQAPNGWMLYIGRADCRSNAERGAVMGVASQARILNFNNANVGIGCGNVHIFDPKAATPGTSNTGITKAGVLPVYGDRGSGDEVNGKIETGLLGITAAKDFATTGHVYMQYYPTFNPNNPVHPGLADGAQRRISKMGQGRISRFTIDLATKKLKLDSEVVIFQYDAQIYSCCHRGGGMAWDSEGNLYVTTGDSNSSQNTGGYSGNFQPQRCPTGPADEASNSHCGTNNVSFNDARRTAGNTNDYNGKLIRIKPVTSIADGAKPTVGIGTTYTLPTASSPNGPNLFDGTEGGGGKTKPEIYAMGLRNPSRLAIDPKTDVPYSAWVGPDAGSASTTAGPTTYESASMLPTAGNYGWPYCMGNGQAYRDRVADGSQRTMNGPGFVNGGPAANQTPGWYDCKNLVNDSTNNTGLVTLPHVTGTGKDAGTARSHSIWWGRGIPGNNHGCPDYPRPAGADAAPDYSATPTQLCPYVTNSGSTVMAGPVYSYDKTATDNSVRWPAYWDGRWFLHNHGGASVKHGLLFDEGGKNGKQPVYADSLRGGFEWSASYMDSKFGADGALYVQVYSGFFSTLSDAGMFKLSYTGGADTPSADPRWNATSTARTVQFSVGASGGVSYAWDFGDGQTSTQANPTHTYAETGSYTSKLTVTYADGEKMEKTATVIVGADAAAPTVTLQVNGQTPAASYTAPVEVTVRATDGAGASGVEWIERRIDGGSWTRAENTANAEPFETKFNVGGNGSHTVEYRARDKAGNESTPVGSVTFRINLNTGGNACLPQSDEFNGATLDPKWTVTRSASGGPTLVNGSLTLPMLQGDFIANDALASNTVLQDAPSGEWTATTRIDTAGINANGEQAGLLLWKSENPNTFAKLVAIQSSNGTKQFEFIVTQNGAVSPPISSSITVAPGGTLPAQVLLRARNNGTNIVGEFSTDDGQSWTRVGQAGHAAPLTGALKVGPVAFRGGQGGGNVTFDYLRVHGGSAEETPVTCSAGCSPQSDQFVGSELDPKWSILNPSASNVPTVGGGHLTLPIINGDLYGGTATAQVLHQDAPTGSWVATAKIAHASINVDGEAAGLALINSTNPNHFLKTTLQYKADTDPDTAGDQPGKWAERVLTSNGNAITLPPATVPWPNSGALSTAGDYVWVRFVHDATAGTITTWTSTNGATFTSFGAAISVSQYLNQAGGLKVGLFAKHDGSGNDTVRFDAFNVVPNTADPQTSADNCGGISGCVQDDAFDGTALDAKWDVRNPTPANLAVAGGKLALTTAQGDVSGGNFTARNIPLQDVPTGPWSVTAKLDHTAISQNGVAGGLVVYGSNAPNYFAKIGVQYKNNDLSGQPMNGIWAERVQTVNGTITGTWGGQYPNTGKLTPTSNDLWLRASYDGTNLISEYSYDGTTFATIAPPVPVATAFGAAGITKIGLFVKHDAGNTARPISFDSFKVEATSCGSGRDSTPPRTNHTLTPASPDGGAGFYKSNVRVSLAATDNDGGTGVDYTEYRIAPATTWTRYSAAFDVTTEGSTTVEYRSVDKGGNVEATRSVSVKIDKAAPTTSAKLNGEAPKANYDGTVAVDLDATDGTGSGVAKTEVRVDGGEWKPYAEEETILATQADYAKWAQAGPGGLVWNAAEGGFFRTTGGLGMPWYPVKDYGDFSLKFQWRDSGTGSNGNGGAFVRFPNPTEAVTRTAANRYPCQVGSAQSDPSWVAIYCGHEIQVNDHQASEGQKTGSVYNFSSLNATQAKVQPKGTWVDYEIKVVGQTYTMIRNGEVLQVFENTRDKPSSRAGDPSTTDRQFARGYIGLQNHGTSDVIDYRNVRVEPLDEGQVKGPFNVTGNGAHKVEFRSTDVAGNVETVKSVDFTIGPEGEKTPPVTASSLNPAQPGAGGVYSGPVDVRLSATDPAEAGSGGGAAATHDVNAFPSAWEPAAVSAKVGDTVRWNFPAATAGTVHDLWLVKPGEGALSDGTRLTNDNGGVAIPGGPPVSSVVDTAGTYTFVCKVHGHKGATAWEGMVGTVTVTSGGSTVPGSGVDFTEYRVNGGAWVRNTNSGNASPFVTTFRAEAEGAYAVEYRSTDKAGNAEATKSVSFSIEEPEDSDSADADVVATVPRVLGITLGSTVRFDTIVPGVAKDYDATTTVTATSSLPASKLTIADPSSTATGHLVNGTLAMPQALKVGTVTGNLSTLGGSASPTLLATWARPLANEAVQVRFRQSVGANDALLVGDYSKRVTLTLSATTP